MPWWVWTWLVIMSLLSVGGTYDDLRSKKPLWYAACDLLSGLLCLVFVAGHFGAIDFRGPPVVLVTLAVLAGGWIIYETAGDLREIRDEGARTLWITIGVALGVGVPFLGAVALGVIDGIRMLRFAA